MAGHIQEAGFGGRPFEHTGQIAQSVVRGGFVTISVDSQADGVTVEAAVKWFNATKGYGFVELSDGRGDAFLHLKTLRETGRQTLPSGAKIRVVARAGTRGV